jgi:hypothetical protein
MATGKQLKAAILTRRAAQGPRKKRTRPEPRQYTVVDLERARDRIAAAERRIDIRRRPTSSLTSNNRRTPNADTLYTHGVPVGSSKMKTGLPFSNVIDEFLTALIVLSNFFLSASALTLSGLPRRE